MKTKVNGVPVVALAYAWGSDISRVSFFVSSTADTRRSSRPHYTSFEDGNGERSQVAAAQPELAAFVYKLLPIIDTHNHHRQGLLSLETKLLTLDSWFRLQTTFVGMAVTNYRNLLAYSDPMGSDFTVHMIANFLSSGLVERSRGWLNARRYAEEQGTFQSHGDFLRIVDRNGDPRKALTTAQTLVGKRTIGSSHQRTCFICRRYYLKKYRMTSFMCKNCGTPICRVDRRAEDNHRSMSCMEEHQTSPLVGIRCDGHVKTCIAKDLIQPNWQDPK
jgi:hypothetical protein